MYLRTVKLAGFKSFADRTRLSFEPGVGIIVGPNGSGKSNVVDAVAWVMGTQSTRALRAHKMEEVIFAGTATRPPVGRAEVVVVFDNADRALPLDLEEVSITRRLYRDGTSEYLINGVDCRLLDIQELLSDSGVGRHQHTIVGQGQIDAILSAGADEHRAIIEEAAGVLKHRVRKDRALRRLERTDGDVARLRDIERELERQIRPLRRQANAAQQHQELRDRVRALRLHIDGLELRRVGEGLAEGQREANELERAIAERSARLQRLSSEIRDLEGVIATSRARLEGDTAAAARLETSLERFARIAQVAHERLRAAVGRAEHRAERRADLAQEIADIEGGLTADRARQGAVDKQWAALTAKVAELAEEERSLAEQSRLPAEGAVAMLRGELSSLQRAAERDREEHDHLMGRLAVLADHLTADADLHDRLDAEIRSLDEAVTAAGSGYAEARRVRESQQRTWEEAEAALHEARLEAASAEAFLKALNAGKDPVTRERVLALAQVRSELIAALDCRPDLIPALEAALGEWLLAVVVDPSFDLAAVAEALAGHEGQGVPVVHELGPVDERSDAEETARRWGVGTLLGQLGPNRQPVADRLLGDVLFVESWKLGWEIVSRDPRVRAVTPEGDLVTSFGIMLHDPRGTPRSRIESAQRAVEAARREVARATSHRVTESRSFDRLREAERVALEDLERLEAQLAGATEALARAERERAAVQEEQRRLESRRAGLAEAESAREERIRSLRTRLEEAEVTDPDFAEQLDRVLSRRLEVEATRLTAERARDAAAAELATLAERMRLLEDRRRSILPELDAAEDHPAAAEPLAAVEAAARAGLAVLGRHLETLRERQQAERAGLEKALLLRQEAEQQESALRVGLEGDRERKAALAVETTELRLRVESVAEGLRRDLDASPEDALTAPTPPLEDAPHRALEDLEARLRRMGPVNPLAVEEYRTLSERLGFLRGQLLDLETSRAKLHRLITELDQRITAEFRVAFEEVAALFDLHFEILFPGGQGRLRLVEPTDPLGSGVEILAQPLGKKVARLSLLSGGERSLAALAFLFSVFRARPSPFYVLDEVEAALDDANLRRFLRLLDEIRSNSQLIIVTHQQQTMEAADVLYGVTMEAGGSSQVVAQRLASAAV